MLSCLAPLALLLPLAFSCPDHSATPIEELVKRQISTPDNGNGNWTTRVPGSSMWAYEFSFNWGRLSPGKSCILPTNAILILTYIAQISNFAKLAHNNLLLRSHVRTPQTMPALPASLDTRASGLASISTGATALPSTWTIRKMSTPRCRP